MGVEAGIGALSAPEARGVRLRIEPKRIAHGKSVYLLRSRGFMSHRSAHAR